MSVTPIRVICLFAIALLGCDAEPEAAAPATPTADQAPSEAAEPEVTEPPEPEPPVFESHVAMIVPEGREFLTGPEGRLPLLVDDDAYWLGAGKKLLKVPRAGGEPETLALGGWMKPFAMRGDEIFLDGDSETIQVLAKGGGEPTKRFDLDMKRSPTVVGDRLVLTAYDKEGQQTVIYHAPLAGGEFTAIPLGGYLRSNRQLAVRGDALLTVVGWGKVVRIGGEFKQAEAVFEFGADEKTEHILDVAWAGDTILVNVGVLGDKPTQTLVRQTSDGARTTLQEAPAERPSILIGDGEHAYWQVEGEGAWLVDAATIQPVDLGGYTTKISATSVGMAWQIGNELRLATKGPEAPIVLPAEAFPKDQLAGLSLGRSGPKLSAKSTTIGPVDASIVRRIMRAHGRDTRRCTKRGGKLDASLTLTFTINAEGKAIEVGAKGGESFPDQAIVTCLVEAIDGWSFGKPGRGGLAKVEHTITFGEG
ncbi:hypothetical protein G6O69_25220 [Pseudenhygromyxa sp. WMMC2535]|uniref:hypothetical protein n=1 Tax=Pseudenhygromyxa sp. WMMC2535 TaxID=2712867 RepID=UPI001557079A|nr:hypothetical protein [Pseudenhygromyxa sp. WMMC2535]NVB41165.1 hypothetical protein [Pseudenhygromyxa sp. WMMC2535]